MALSISNEPVVVNTEAQLADIFQHSISLSALAWPLVYQFPVQQISPTFFTRSCSRAADLFIGLPK
jgi:hypothetical protein